MQTHAVESSFIKAVSYSRATHTLLIEFSSGSVYEYADVSRHRRDRFLSAESIGRYFNAHIRGKYQFKIVGEQ